MATSRFTDNALIHDRWFSVTGIREDGSELVIPFASAYVSRARTAVFDSTLRISHVLAWRVDDSEKIEVYNFSGLTYDEGRGCIQIEAGIPLTVEADVSAFAVTVETP
jgi:hypothetical protein